MTLALLTALIVSGQFAPEPLAPNVSCRACHAAPATADVGMSWDSHRGSLMELAGVDPFFLAAWEIAQADDENVAVLCAQCHFPSATAAGRTPTQAIFDPSFAGDLDGIACDLCHRFSPPTDAAGEPVFDGLMGNARYTVGPIVPKLGPFDPHSTQGHPSATGPVSGRSETCGVCHDVSDTLRERVGGPGVGGPVPLERTYREWTQSVYGRPGPDYQTCQDCHMAANVGRATTLTSVPDDRPLADHRIVGSTTRAPKMIALYPEVLGDAAPINTTGLTPYTDKTSAAALAMLERAARVDVVVVDEEVRVRVTNDAGHKLPTGYSEGRRMWLEVAREDGAECVSLGGQWDAATCDIDVAAPPLGLWEAVLGEGETKSLHFALIDSILHDSRIPPRGFTPDDDTQPVAHTFEVLQDADGASMANWDDVSLGATPTTRTVFVARLLFQSTHREFLTFLVDGAETAGPILRDLFIAAGPYRPEVMKTIRFAVEIDGTVEILDAQGTTCLSVLDGPPEPCLGESREAAPTVPDPKKMRVATSVVVADSDDETVFGCTQGAPRPYSAWALALVLFALRRRTPLKAIQWHWVGRGKPD